MFRAKCTQLLCTSSQGLIFCTNEVCTYLHWNPEVYIFSRMHIFVLYSTHIFPRLYQATVRCSSWSILKSCTGMFRCKIKDTSRTNCCFTLCSQQWSIHLFTPYRYYSSRMPSILFPAWIASPMFWKPEQIPTGEVWRYTSSGFNVRSLLQPWLPIYFQSNLSFFASASVLMRLSCNVWHCCQRERKLTSILMEYFLHFC